MTLHPPSVSRASFVLEGSIVRLEPLEPTHVPRLLEASNEDPSLYVWTIVPQTRAAMEAYVEVALAGRVQGSMVPFAIVRRADQRVVGSTRFMNVERWAWPPEHPERARLTPDVCEIGTTWLARSAMRTAINTEAKYLLLAHAFEAWRVHRVSLRTDRRNAQSRAAIERIGARPDGVVRCDRPGVDGAVRDSAVYSIVAAEWPDVRDRLERLNRR
jgi:RimJ/RimL family protein N-acetyltransferase